MLGGVTLAAHRLPSPVTSFIGREQELATVHNLVVENRLVTLTGPGGCGKTRLALPAAAEATDRHPDGLAWVDLAPLADAELVPSAIATALAVPEIAGHDLLDTVVHHLADRRVLVVLDNCEHVVSACAIAADALLSACPGVTLLATSREPLGVGGEVTYRVPSLSLPSNGGAIDQYEAVRLFIDRAMRAKPGFGVTNDNAPAVAQICHRLDGIPLAIELAAARVRMMTVEQVLDGLADRFRLLTGGSRTALPRQQTLEASVEWSHALLVEKERALLRRLSVFAGSFSLAGASAVGGGGDVVGPLGDLVDKSLVQVEDDDTEARYRLLETIRLYARRKLLDADEADAALAHHVAFYAAMADDVGPRLERHGMVECLDRLDAELDNARAAHDRSVETGDADAALRIVAGFGRYWSLRGHLTEGQRRGAQALALDGGEPRLRGHALVAQALTEMLLLEWQAEFDCGEEAAAIGRVLGDEVLTARGAGFLADGAQFLDRARFRAVIEEAIAAARSADDRWALSWALLVAAQFESMQGDVEHAVALGTEALDEARALGDLFVVAASAYVVAFPQSRLGRIDDAIAAIEECVDAGRRLRERSWASAALALLAMIEVSRGRYDEARIRIAESRAVAGDDPAGTTTADAIEAWLWAMVDGAADAALERLEHAVTATGGGPGFAEFAVMLAEVRVAAGDVDRARAELSALTVAHVGAALAMAAIDRLGGDLARAETLVHESLPTAVRNAVLMVPDALDLLAGIAAEQESAVEAARLFGAASSLRDTMGLVRFPVRQAGYDTDVTMARERLGAADFDTAWQQGAALGMDEAVELARRGRGERRRPSTGWASLTPTEQRIVPLVAEHLTNADIGTRLFMAPTTVKTHLSHIFAKLSISSRAELASAAIRKGLA